MTATAPTPTVAEKPAKKTWTSKQIAALVTAHNQGHHLAKLDGHSADECARKLKSLGIETPVPAAATEYVTELIAALVHGVYGPPSVVGRYIIDEIKKALAK